ncbi:hypothetical protein EYF80_013026 [Liparis tanakae]|uniref:Uncharacterized protein n=1 Tax=Liparis tanakae TaxID=230148 RepID=A0A4Z2IG62_9TELE|nr:hypothetical protein EYF80_013026 [Liparis tanakae]
MTYNGRVVIWGAATLTIHHPGTPNSFDKERETKTELEMKGSERQSQTPRAPAVLSQPRSSTVTQLRQGSGALPTSVSGGYDMRGLTHLGIRRHMVRVICKTWGPQGAFLSPVHLFQTGPCGTLGSPEVPVGWESGRHRMAPSPCL